MHKIGRWILLALFVAFLAGLMPTIFEWCDRFFVFTEEGLGVTRHFTHTVDSVFLTLLFAGSSSIMEISRSP